MRVSLKRAGELAHRALAIVNANRISTTVDVSIYTPHDPAGIIADARAEAMSDLDRMVNLISAAYALRNIIGRLNDETGIDARRTEVVMLETQARKYEEIVSSSRGHVEDVDTLKAHIAAFRNSSDSERIYHRDKLSVELFNKEDRQKAADIVAQLRRRISSLNEEIAGINATTQVEIPENVCNVLRTAKLID